MSRLRSTLESKFKSFTACLKYRLVASKAFMGFFKEPMATIALSSINCRPQKNTIDDAFERRILVTDRGLELNDEPNQIKKWMRSIWPQCSVSQKQRKQTRILECLENSVESVHTALGPTLVSSCNLHTQTYPEPPTTLQKLKEKPQRQPPTLATMRTRITKAPPKLNWQLQVEKPK